MLHYLIEKEFKQMMRNIILPIVFIMLPIGMINLMPRAATQEVKNLTLSVIDNDHSGWSQRLIQKLSASTYFTLTDVSSTYEAALHRVEAGDADFIVEIEPDFERNLVREEVSHVLISANAVNGVKAGLGSSYLSQIITDYAMELREEQGAVVSPIKQPEMEVAPRYLYNATLDYKYFMIPGLIAMLLVLIVGFLPALNIVGEKEKGTIEQINVTPIGRFEFIFSKLIPYWLVGLFILSYAMLLSRLIYGFVPVGSLGLIYLFATLFILVISSFGLIVSNYSDTAQQAALVMFFFLVIFILLSGLLTPIASMPRWAQAITLVNPFRYFIEVMRALYLKGSTFHDLLPNFYALSLYALIVWSWAIRSYRKVG
ncbi:MAG: ABC transporter permease [Parabacteroides sp.]